jgi:hypothetical protein
MVRLLQLSSPVQTLTSSAALQAQPLRVRAGCFSRVRAAEPWPILSPPPSSLPSVQCARVHAHARRPHPRPRLPSPRFGRTCLSTSPRAPPCTCVLPTPGSCPLPCPPSPCARAFLGSPANTGTQAAFLLRARVLARQRARVFSCRERSSPYRPLPRAHCRLGSCLSSTTAPAHTLSPLTRLFRHALLRAHSRA